MRIFFAGAFIRTYEEAAVSIGVKSYLASYEDQRGVGVVARIAARCRPDNAFILDSGAFSAWNSGRSIDLDEYIAYAKDFIGRNRGLIDHIYVVNLDVIPGVQGTKPTKKEVEEAAKQGWANMLRMEAAGLTPLHIFHQGEDFEWLERLAARHRYIGISPSNDASGKSKFLWMQRVFGTIRANNMTHGFAVTARKLMQAFPWYSVDSTSWMAPAVYGKSVFTPEFEKIGLATRCRTHVDYVIHANMREIRRLQRVYTQLWGRRGVVWDEDEPM
jgi:hypothetical protein